MRTKLFKIALAATLGLALAFTFSCSSSDDPDNSGDGSGGNINNNNNIPSSSSYNWKEAYHYYDPADEKKRCQNGVLEAKCEDSWYNYLTHYCLGKEIVELCGEYTEANLWVNTLSNITSTIKRCQGGIFEYKCGDNWYNQNTHTCSDNMIVAREMEPCGNGYYIVGDNVRCRDGVVEGKCGDSWYNSSTHTCNNNTIEFLVLAFCGDGAFLYSPSEGMRCQDGAAEAKCGSVWYNIHKQMCKNNTVENKPRCGS
jgi:hypothetical protein